MRDEAIIKLLRENYIGKGVLIAKMEELSARHNNFRDMVFNVSTRVEEDFIRYETYKELLNEMSHDIPNNTTNK